MSFQANAHFQHSYVDRMNNPMTIGNRVQRKRKEETKYINFEQGRLIEISSSEKSLETFYTRASLSI